jgi:hypothetical protein
MDLIAEVELDIADSSEKMPVRVYRPEFDARFGAWKCRIEIGPPLNISRSIPGESSLQSLILGIKTVSFSLYGSDLYKQGRLGLYGVFGEELCVPASHEFLDIAPYPF